MYCYSRAWQHGFQPLSFSLIGPLPCHAEAEARGHPRENQRLPVGHQPRGTAVFNERLGPEAKPQNVPESAEAASPALLRGPPPGPGTPPCTAPTGARLCTGAWSLGWRWAHPIRAQHPAQCALFHQGPELRWVTFHPCFSQVPPSFSAALPFSLARLPAAQGLQGMRLGAAPACVQ